MEKEIADLKEQLKEAKATSDSWKSKYEETERLRTEAARSRVVADKSATALQKEAATKQKNLEAAQANLATSRKALEQQQNQCKKYHQLVQTAAAIARQLQDETDELRALAFLPRLLSQPTGFSCGSSSPTRLDRSTCNATDNHLL